MLFSLIGTAPLLLALLYVPSYPALLVVGTVLGAVSQVFRPAATTMISVVTPQSEQVMIFAMVRLATNLGTTAGPLLGAALIAVSYDPLFWGEALVVLVFAVIVALAVPARYPAGPGADARPATDPDPEAALGADPAPKPGAIAGYRPVLADRYYQVWWWYVVACGLGAAAAWVAMSRSRTPEPQAHPGPEADAERSG